MMESLANGTSSCGALENWDLDVHDTGQCDVCLHWMVYIITCVTNCQLLTSQLKASNEDHRLSPLHACGRQRATYGLGR